MVCYNLTSQMSDDVTLAIPEHLRLIPRTKSIPELIFNEMVRLVTEGLLKPGDRLPSESELAERFGVGRSSLREAMRALQLLGIVEVIQGKGTFLRQTYMLPLTTDWARLSGMGLISQVMEARQIIEVAIAQLAAERATEEDIVAMRAAIRQAEAEATHNEVLALMYKTVRDLYLETARQTQITLANAEERLHDHRRILECVEQQNPELASKLMAEHIEKGRQFLATR